ncbi:MAG: helix-turn-helix domain-containing protein [Pseudomonadales bacterium]|nr:helix-turn-helix domain-containing protein [Pseudomonadales bacterium]
MSATLATSRIERPACNTCAVKAHCLASSVEKENQLKFESSRMDMRVMRKGQHVYRAGDEFEALYIVRSGAVKATAISEDGTEQVTGFYLPGEIFGMDGIAPGEYTSNAILLETSSVCVYSFSRLLDVCQESAGLQRQLWHQVSLELASRQRMLMTMGHRSAEARLAEFLMSLSLRFKRIGYSATSFNLPMSRQDIADYLGLSVETVCRVLTRFQKAGTLQRDQREITLMNVEALQALSIGTLETRIPRSHDSENVSKARFHGSNEYAAAAS